MAQPSLRGGGGKRHPQHQSIRSFVLGMLCTGVLCFIRSFYTHNPAYCASSKQASDLQEEQTQKADSSVVSTSTSSTPIVNTTTATMPLDNNNNKEEEEEQVLETELEQWKWYEGDVNQYYNELEKEITTRDPKDINKYAVHRWMGPKVSTTIHYELILESIMKYTGRVRKDSGISNLKVLDAGSGLGSALMWFEQHNPSWTLVGRTLSEEQVAFVETKLPQHKFTVELGSYNDLPEGVLYDSIYSIEAMIHSTDIHATLKAWADHLHPDHGSIVVIDDFLMPGANKDTQEMQLFAKGWMANSFYTVRQLHSIARRYGLEMVESRDLLAPYRIIELNYRNKVPTMDPDNDLKTHQGWMGSKWRHKLTVEGKIAYNLVVFQKQTATKLSILESLESAASSSVGPPKN